MDRFCGGTSCLTLSCWYDTLEQAVLPGPQGIYFHRGIHRVSHSINMETSYGRILLMLVVLLSIVIVIYSGWWFQTFFIFHNIWDNPSH